MTSSFWITLMMFLFHKVGDFYERCRLSTTLYLRSSIRWPLICHFLSEFYGFNALHKLKCTKYKLIGFGLNWLFGDEVKWVGVGCVCFNKAKIAVFKDSKDKRSAHIGRGTNNWWLISTGKFSNFWPIVDVEATMVKLYVNHFWITAWREPDKCKGI